ncbi:tetratricopeptide repeat protein [Laspinema palackyanum]|uniref:tetratricopeptide repeat protein n=1 Tax=Laspinema palackyanum TaxID=3231601 RepID=UPI003F540AC6
MAHQGETYFYMGSYKDAVEAFTKAIKLNPNYAWAIAHRGRVLRYLGLNERAAKHFKRSIDLIPEYAWSHAYLSVIYALMDQYKKAWDCLMRAIELDPTLPIEALKSTQVSHLETTMLRSNVQVEELEFERE